MLTPTLPRDARDTLFLLGVIGWIVLMQVPHIPAWCSALTLGVLAWRAHQAWRNQPLPGWGWRLALLAAALWGTWFTHRTLLGPEAGVTLIVVLLALKTLELRARRDAFVVFFLGFFTLLTHFFHSQSLLTAIGILLALMGLLTALVNAHMPVGRPPLRQAARLAGGMALLGTPIMVVLFVLFPRFSPLWGIPSDGLSGRSGLSGQMQVGQIARLALDDSIALRVAFEGPPPPPSELYFRGPVFGHFDGLQWEALPPGTGSASGAATGLEVQGAPVRYRVTLEPSNKPWLMVLDATADAPAVPGHQVRRTPDLQWLTRAPITDTVRYDAQSHTHYRLGLDQPPWSLRPYQALPAGYNPRTLQLAQDIRRDAGPQATPAERVQRVLEHLRSGGYTYTLEPGVYGQHTADEFWFDRKAGLCEHIASSFVVLLRAMDVPARIVTGYQGGERNPVDGVWTVRQSDAHAWAEVWLPGEGWTRIDPTTAVAPGRTASLERLRPAPGFVGAALLTLHPNLALQVRAVWEAMNNHWNQWVLNHTQSRQLDLLRWLGFQTPSWADLAYALLGVLVLVSLAGAGWTLWERQQHDPWLRLLQRARQRLRQAGLPVPEHATPRQLQALVHRLSQDGLDTTELERWLLDLEAVRYDPAPSDRATLQALRGHFRHLPWPHRPATPNRPATDHRP